jgi:hypothetical protein
VSNSKEVGFAHIRSDGDIGGEVEMYWQRQKLKKRLRRFALETVRMCGFG